MAGGRGDSQAALPVQDLARRLRVLLDRDGGDFTRTLRLGLTRFEPAVRRELTSGVGRTRACGSSATLLRPRRSRWGVRSPSRRSRARRLLLEDWADPTKLADTETRMMAVLEDLELTELATSIKGLSPVGAAAILAETGDLSRFTTSRAVVKHAGLAPRQRSPAPSPAAPS